LGQIFGVCRDAGVQVQMVSQGASKVNISFIVNDEETPELVKALHRHFFGGKTGGKPDGETGGKSGGKTGGKAKGSGKAAKGADA
jgi:hypothetical protein